MTVEELINLLEMQCDDGYRHALVAMENDKDLRYAIKDIKVGENYKNEPVIILTNKKQ